MEILKRELFAGFASSCFSDFLAQFNLKGGLFGEFPESPAQANDTLE